MVNVVEECKERLKELNALRPLSHEQELRVLQKLRLDWNFHSNHLEGNSLTYGETKALILHGLTAQGKPIQDHIEISGHHEAILLIEDLVKRREALTENVIRQLHVLILKENHYVDARTASGEATKVFVQVGSYKTTPNHVLTVTGETLLFSSPMDTPLHMRELIDWYQAASQEGDPIEVSCVFHHRFTRIHPFADGNGRVARLLANFILMMSGYPPVIIKTEEKDGYFAALRLADADNPSAFVEYIGTQLLRSLDLVIRGAQGESVDEADDTQKELALLRQQFESGKDKVNVVRSKSLAEGAWTGWIAPFFEEVVKRAEGFSEFYLSKQIVLVVNGNIYAGAVSEQSQFVASKIGSAREIGVQIRFDGIRTRKHVESSFIHAVYLTLHNTHLEVSSGDRNKLAEIDWDQVPTSDDLKGWASREEKRHLTFVTPRLAP